MILLDDLVRGTVLDLLGQEGADLSQPGDHLDLVEQAFGRLHPHQFPNPAGHLLDGADFERDLHPPRGAERVDEHRHRAVFHIFKKQRRSAALRDAVGDLGNFQERVHFDRDPLQLVRLLQGANKLP